MGNATEAFQPLQADDPLQVAGYRLAARLGAGGMGRVYLSHTQGGRPVAIKVVRPELADDPDFVRRFRREVEAARRVRGAYTAELIDADADGVPPWLATLYVPGPSLAEAVHRHGPLATPAVLWLMAGVAEALQAIHGAGIVHRDLKPSNVLLAADGPRVIDFGISLASDLTSHTATGAAVGTPQYMAPEQATAGAVTAATDVFALGQTAAFAALGKPLYGEGSAVGVLYRIVHDAPDLSVLPAQLRPLIARCLAAEPQERATPAEIVEWCRRELGQDSAEGPGPAVWQEVRGPQMTVPAPVPDPAPARTLPLLTPTRPTPTPPDRPRSRRRRAALITAAVASALLLAGVTWTVMRAGAGSDDRASGGSSSTTGARAGTGAEAGTETDSRASTSAQPSSAAPRTPQPEAHPQRWLDEKNSLDIADTDEREDRKGDLRFVCETVGCALETGTNVIGMVYSERPGATLDTCRLVLTGAKTRSLPLAAAAAGSEICVKDPAGNIALFVVQVKSTALWDTPGISFLSADMTLWRAT
ncbi:serine/threonine-protein kinase [Streptomyces sp. NPDC001858]